MKTMRIFGKAALAIFTFFLVVTALTGCGKDVAATVNGEKILESTITEKIMTTRNAEASYMDDSAWAAALYYAGMTPETLREQAIRSEASLIIIRQMAKEQGLVPDTVLVDFQIEQARQITQMDGGEWLSTLKRYGYASEEAFRESLELENLRQQLIEAMDGEPDNTEFNEFVLGVGKYYVGKRSSAIMLYPTDQQSPEDIINLANQIERELSDGADFRDLVAQYSMDTSTAMTDGDMGWSSLVFYDPIYSKTLESLAVGEVSAPITTEAGVVYIIKCTDQFVLSEDGTVKYEEVPIDILDMLRDQWASSNQSNSFQRMLEQRLEEADFVINPMPKGLPYDVDMGILTNTENEN